MSWSEIKKINSNIDTTIDKYILNELSYINMFSQNATGYNSAGNPTECIRIEGTGRLLGVMFNIQGISDRFRYPYIQLIVDDNYIVNLQNTYAPTATTRTYIVLGFDWLPLRVKLNTQYEKNNIGSQGWINTDANSGPTFRSTTHVTNGLKFKKNVIVRIRGTATISSPNGIVYTLNE